MASRLATVRGGLQGPRRSDPARRRWASLPPPATLSCQTNTGGVPLISQHPPVAPPGCGIEDL
eukprot:7805377-Pyramimonas_sp.AAC.1